MTKSSGGGFNALGRALTMGLNMAAAIAAGYYLGRFLDGRLGTSPRLTLLFFIFGVGVGMWLMYRSALSQTKDLKRTTPNPYSRKDNAQRLEKLEIAREQLKEVQALQQSYIQKEQETIQEMRSMQELADFQEDNEDLTDFQEDKN